MTSVSFRGKIENAQRRTDAHTKTYDSDHIWMLFCQFSQRLKKIICIKQGQFELLLLFLFVLVIFNSPQTLVHPGHGR